MSDFNMSDFNKFRFAGLDCKDKSNKYLTMNRVSADENKIVVKVGDAHIFKARYGYGLILDRTHLVWLKDWQVSENYYGIEVLLTKEYFNVKESSLEFSQFGDEPDNLTWEEWLKTAKAQDSILDEDGFKANPVKWEK